MCESYFFFAPPPPCALITSSTALLFDLVSGLSVPSVSLTALMIVLVSFFGGAFSMRTEPAPLAAWFTRKLPMRPMTWIVGAVVMILAAYQAAQLWGVL